MLELNQAEPVNGWIIRFEDDLNAEDLRQCCQLFGQKTGRAIILSAKIADSREEVPMEYRYAMFSTHDDARAVAKTFNQRFAGQGGGNATLVQGTMTGLKREIEKIIIDGL